MTVELRQALDSITYSNDAEGRPIIEVSTEAAGVAVVAAARWWLTLLEADEKIVEKVAEAIYYSGLPTASFDKRGHIVPFERSLAPGAFRNAALIVLAAIVGEET